jgi:uncharacterized membrane protein YeiH
MSLQYLLEHFGVAVAAITGVLAARGKQVDLFGVIVLALVTAFGGGTVRDLTLGDTPVFWVKDPNFLLNATAVAVVAFFVARFHAFPETVLLVADAFALALFTMVGARKALELSMAPSIVIAMGVITGVVGGIIRDVLTREIPLVLRRQMYLYATAAFAGSLVFVLLNHWKPDADRRNQLAGLATTLALRLAAIRWRLDLPEFRDRSESPRREG